MKQKSHLFRENQLLYGVVQIDKKEEAPKLTCRWFDDLTKADDAMMEVCDRAYDKAKQFSARMGTYAKARDDKPKKEKVKVMETTPTVSKMLLTVDADQFNLRSDEAERAFPRIPGSCASADSIPQQRP